MITSNVAVTISYDSTSESDLKNVLSTLKELRYAFEKSGGYVDTEISVLEDAELIVSNVINGKPF